MLSDYPKFSGHAMLLSYPNRRDARVFRDFEISEVSELVKYNFGSIHTFSDPRESRL